MSEYLHKLKINAIDINDIEDEILQKFKFEDWKILVMQKQDRIKKAYHFLKGREVIYLIRTFGCQEIMHNYLDKGNYE